MHLTPHLGPQVSKGCGCIGFLSHMHKKITDSYLRIDKRLLKGNKGLSSQKRENIPV